LIDHYFLEIQLTFSIHNINQETFPIVCLLIIDQIFFIVKDSFQWH
jgi:hypothetical protein